MRIVVDVQGAISPGSGHRGVGRYTVEMVKSLAQAVAGRHELFIVANGALGATKSKLFELFSGNVNPENIKIFMQYVAPVAAINGNEGRRHAAELIREWFIEQLNPDVIWIPNLQEGWHDESVTSVGKLKSTIPVCSCLHDVIPLQFEEKYLVTHIRSWYFEKIEFAKKSNLLLTLSEYSKQEIHDRLKFPAEKIFVAPCSYRSDTFFKQEASSRTVIPSLSDGMFFLYVGGADEHKNLRTLIHAHALLPQDMQDAFPLVLVGKDVAVAEGHFRDISHNAGGTEASLLFLGYVSDKDLSVLYSACTAFIFPSRSEGFGLPPLEAMACAAPVLVADAASLPEVVSFPGARFDPDDPDGLSLLLQRVIDDKAFREELRAHGAEDVKRFSWDNSAAIILDAMEKLVPMQQSREGRTDRRSLVEAISALPQTLALDDGDLKNIARSISENIILSKTERHLYIDISCLVHFDHATGIQRVVRAIMAELLADSTLDQKVSLIYSYAGHTRFYHVHRDENGKPNPIPEDHLNNYVVDFSDGDMILILDLHPGSLISKRSELERLHSRGIRVCVVVYDLLPVEFPDYFVPELSAEFIEWLKTVALADTAVCISRDVSCRLRQWISMHCTIRNPLLKIKYFHLGADISNSIPSKGVPADAPAVLDIISSSSSFLMVGTVEPRKAHAFVLDAFEKLWIRPDSDHILVIVGKEGWRNEKVAQRIRQHQELGKRLFWLFGISDEYLEKIYQSSTCLIAASENEGFGLPLIEAAQHKLPIIARDIPVFREVSGEYAYYFSGNVPENLASTILKWQSLYKQRAHPRSDAMPWLTWAQSAEQLKEALGLLETSVPVSRPRSFWTRIWDKS